MKVKISSNFDNPYCQVYCFA